MHTHLRTAAALMALALAAPAAARTPRTLKLRFPAFSLAAGGNRELCALVRLPATTPFDVASYEIRHRGVRADFAPQHFLVYQYRGERLGEFAAAAGQLVPSRGCLDVGPADRDQRVLIGNGTSPRTRKAFPPGVALRLEPVPASPGGAADGLGFVLSGEWINAGTRARRASSKVILRRVGAKETRRPARLFQARGAEDALAVAPGSVRSTEASTGIPPGDVWRPAQAACVILLSGHMHKRGLFFGVDRLDAMGAVQPVDAGIDNPFEAARVHFFGGPDYTDVGLLDRRSDPLLVRPEEGLRYACWDDNGVTTPVRLGCEESVGMTPGAPGLAAKPCPVTGGLVADCPAVDVAYPGRSFTGACVPATVVAGPPPDDEACVLVGAAFDALVNVAPGGECPTS